MNQKMNLVEHVASGLSLWTAATSVTRSSTAAADVEINQQRNINQFVKLLLS